MNEIDSATAVDVGGPFFDQLVVGQIFDTAPTMTLTSGAAATHQSIVGDRLRLPLDQDLSTNVTGRETALAHPSLVCDIAIGQSTLATHHVKANLFYRGLRFLSHPHIGDTLRTHTEVTGLKANSVKPGRQRTGLAALRVVTTDQNGRPVLDFHRCAMIPFSTRSDGANAAANDDLASIGTDADEPFVVPAEWDLSTLPTRRIPTYDLPGTWFRCGADVVSSAPELARLTLNIAATHHDARVNGGQRLVYGGHTIGIALAQATRALPDLVTVLGWKSCDHLGPVHEGDTVASRLNVVSVERAGRHAAILSLRSVVEVVGGASGSTPVLDWRFTALAGQ